MPSQPDSPDRSDPPNRQSGSPSGKGLNRELIVTSAVGVIDREGLAGLTMRSLGRELDVEAMALYRYVTGREDLLEGVVVHLLTGLHETIDADIARSWQGYLQTLAHAVREIALDHPAAFPLIASRHPAAPWLRPPLRSLELVEHFLATMSGFGLDDERVVAIYRSFCSFLLGHLLLEASVRGAETGPADEPLDEGDATLPNRDGDLGLDQAPTILAFKGLLSQDHSQAEFETSLETLLDRIELSVSQ